MSPGRVATRGSRIAGALLVCSSFGFLARAASPEDRLAQAEVRVREAAADWSDVERRVATRPLRAPEERLRILAAEAERQWLAKDWPAVATLYAGLLADERFAKGATRSEPFYRLGFARAQLGDASGARAAFRDSFKLYGPHAREALARTLELSTQLNAFKEVDAWIQRVRSVQGDLAPDLAFLYGKWLVQRKDATSGQRLDLADAQFRRAARATDVTLALKSVYLLGVTQVQRKNLEAGLARFNEVDHASPADPGGRAVVELAHLAAARILLDQHKPGAALARYDRIPRGSSVWPEALHESAWAKVALGDVEGARDRIDLLLASAPDSRVAAEASILEARLLLKFKRWDEAAEAYQSVIGAYAPLRDDLEALLTTPRAASPNTARASADALVPLVPALALAWANGDPNLTRAAALRANQQEASRSLRAADALADVLQGQLEGAPAELVPELQTCLTRLDAVDSALAAAEENLTDAEGDIALRVLRDDERTELLRVRAEGINVHARFQAVPTGAALVTEREREGAARVAAADRDVFRLSSELGGLSEMLDALQSWVVRTRRGRSTSVADEQEFLLKLDLERSALEGLDADAVGLRARLGAARARAATGIAGERAIRDDLLAATRAEHATFSAAERRLSGDAAARVASAHALRTKVEALRRRTSATRGVLEQRVRLEVEGIRGELRAERGRLEDAAAELAAREREVPEAGERLALLGIARVRRQFQDLLLDADVGATDVAFARMQARSAEIQQIALQKDDRLKVLDREFQRLLREADSP